MSEIRFTYEDVKDKVNGRLELTVLLQKRVRDLMNGSPPLVTLEKGDYIDIALEEIKQDKIFLDTGTPEEIEDMKQRERLMIAKMTKKR
jgi:DNA-directed RNA polymerase subunit omega